MTTKKLTSILKRYQSASRQKKRDYFAVFEPKMLYRTTKTENPETTKAMVRKVLKKPAKSSKSSQ